MVSSCGTHDRSGVDEVEISLMKLPLVVWLFGCLEGIEWKNHEKTRKESA